MLRAGHSALRHKTLVLHYQSPHMPPGCGGRRGALFDKYPHAGRCSKHIKKLIPAGLWHRFAWPAFRRQSFVPVIASEVGTNS